MLQQIVDKHLNTNQNMYSILFFTWSLGRNHRIWRGARSIWRRAWYLRRWTWGNFWTRGWCRSRTFLWLYSWFDGDGRCSINWRNRRRRERLLLVWIRFSGFLRCLHCIFYGLNSTLELSFGFLIFYLVNRCLCLSHTFIGTLFF